MTPTIQRYVLDGTSYSVDLKLKLGAGAEGMVVAHPRNSGACIKLYHPADPGDADGARLAAFRERKVRALCATDLHLPSQFILPARLAFDASGARVVGYQMPRVPPDYHKLVKLLDATFRTDHQMGLRRVAELFADLFDDLAMVHNADLVVGDVNLGCVMFKPGEGRAWVDTDSWSFDRYPCLATTELFAHPDLYGNLNGQTRVYPVPHHDRFAFLIALTMAAIPGAHPFRLGMHPKVRGLQNRTEQGITIFDSDVKVPPMFSNFEVLSDDVLDAIITRLKRHTNAPLDHDLLRAFASEVVPCGKCGTEYHSSRRNCPQCREATVIQAARLTHFIIEEVFKAQGALLFAQVIGDKLYLVCRANGAVEVLRISDSGGVTALSPSLPSIPGARYRFFDDCLTVCPEPSAEAPVPLQLFRIKGTSLHRLPDTSTGVLEGEGAVFDTSARFLYRTAANALVRCELFGAGTVSDTPVAEIHQQQSWFIVDRTADAKREAIFGYDRALRNWQWFIIHGETDGGRYRYHQVGDLGLHTDETVEDFAVYFSTNSVLLVMQTLHRGHDFVRYAVVKLDGSVLINKVIDSSHATYPHWINLRGKLHQGKSVLHVTPDGIVKQTFGTDECVTLGDTTGHVTADDRLIRFRGRVGIVRQRGVLTLSPK